MKHQLALGGRLHTLPHDLHTDARSGRNAYGAIVIDLKGRLDDVLVKVTSAARDITRRCDTLQAWTSSMVSSDRMVMSTYLSRATD